MARSTFPSQNVKNTRGSDHFWKLRCRKSARRCGAKHISKSKCTKHLSFGPLLEVEFEKVHAVVARSTFRSQNVKNNRGSDHFWQLRCRKSARCCGAKHISKSKCTKHHMFAPLLEVRMLKKCTPLWREAHFQVKMYKTPHVRATFGGSDVPSLRFTTLHYITLHYTTFHYTTLQLQLHNYTTTQLHNHTTTQLLSTTLNYITLHYITLHYTPLHYITLHSTTLHYTRLHYLPLHFTTLLYTTLHYNYNYNYTTTQLHYTPLHSTTLNYTTLHYIPLHYTPLHYTTLHYLPLHSTTLNYTTLHYITLHYFTLNDTGAQIDR